MTGTSSVQAMLCQSPNELKQQGYSFFARDLDGSPRPIGDTNVWLSFKPGGRVECAIRADLAARLKDQEGNVVVSAEHFSWVFDEREIRRFRNRLRRTFDQIMVVAYVQRQDRHAIHHYHQGSEFGAFAAARFYDGNYRALPEYREYFHRYLNYSDRLGMWANVFGDGNLVIRVFDEKDLRGGDIVADFLWATGLKLDVPQIEKMESRGFEQNKLGHLMNREHVPLLLQKRLLRHCDNSGKLLPSRKSAVDFYQHFRESNRQLNERFRINDSPFLFDESFDDYPEEPGDLWSEDSANHTITHLLQAVNRLPVLVPDDIELLGKSAHSIANIDEAQSEALESLVNRLDMRNRKEPGGVELRHTWGIKSFLVRTGLLKR